MKVAKAVARDRKRARRVRGMRVDDSARQVALQQRDRQWRQARQREPLA